MTAKSVLKELEEAKIKNQEWESKYEQLQMQYDKLYEQNNSILEREDENFLASPAAKQLREELDIANKKNAFLKRSLERERKKNEELIEMVQNPQPTHNARGAGRKAHDGKWMQNFLQFVDLCSDGKSSSEIMQQMQISKSTYHRYRKEALLQQKISKNNI